MGAPSATVHRSFGNARRTIAVGFWPNSTSAALAVDGPDAGAVASAVRGAAGVYTITMRESYKAMVAIGGLHQSSPAEGCIDCEVTAGTSTASKVVVTRLDADTAVDDTAGAAYITLICEVEACSA